MEHHEKHHGILYCFKLLANPEFPNTFQQKLSHLPAQVDVSYPQKEFPCPNRIHVWYIYVHVSLKVTKCKYI